MFNRTLSLLIAVLLLAGLAGLNVLAFRYFWYWRWWWFDLFMHGTGGLAIGLAVNAFTWRANQVVSWWKPAVLAGLSALIIGLGWELFEFTLDRAARLEVVVKSVQTLQLGWYDTITDLLAGFMGAVLGGAFTSWQLKNNVPTQS